MKKLILVVSFILFLANPAWSDLIEYNVTGEANYLSFEPGSVTGSIFIEDTGWIYPAPGSITENFIFNIGYWILKFDYPPYNNMDSFGNPSYENGSHGIFITVFNPDGSFDETASSLILTGGAAILNGFQFPTVDVRNSSTLRAGVLPYEFSVWVGETGLPLYPRLTLTQDPIPEPATMLLLGIGLIFLVAVRRKKQV